jgi:hypothetical protein
MDLGQLAEQVAETLHPYIGTLITAGIGALGKDAWEGVKTIWERLAPSIKKSPELKAAVEDLAAHPDATKNLASFREAIRKVLEQNPELASELISTYEADQFTVSTHDIYTGNKIDRSQNAQIGPSISSRNRRDPR